MSDRNRFDRGRQIFPNGRYEKRGRDRSSDSHESGPSRKLFDRFSARGRGARGNGSGHRGGGGSGRGRGGRGRGGRGGKGKPNERPEFFDQIKSKPEGLKKNPVPNEKNCEIVTVKANFFRVSMSQRFSVTQYRIDFPPDIESKGLRRSLVQSSLKNFGCFLFDDGNSIFFLEKLPQPQMTVKCLGRDGRERALNLRSERVVHFTDANYLQILNLVVRNSMRATGLQLVGRNFFDPAKKILVPAFRVQLWPGFITSIRQHEQDILLSCKLAHKIMREENILAIIIDCRKEGGDFQRRAVQKILGSTVLTDYNNETYKVSDIDWNQNPESTFEMKGEKVSYMSYYRKKYNKTGIDPKQPLLIAKPTAKNIRGGKNRLICLIPQLCRATGITDDMIKNRDFTRAMANENKMNPTEYVQRLRQFNRRLKENCEADQIFKENRMKLDNQLVNIEAQQLKPETIYFHRNECSLAGANGDWTHLLQNNQMLKTADVKNWYFVFPKGSESIKDDFMAKLKQVAQRLNMFLEEPNLHPIEYNKPSYQIALRSIMQKDPLFIMVFVKSQKGTEMYKIIKQSTLCPESGLKPVPVQVVSEDTWRKRQAQSLSIATKIAIQINCKLGGIPWKVDLKLSGLMIVGFDVSHDANTKKRSYGAMVASLNPTAEHHGHFYSAVNQHENGEQLSNQFGKNLIGALRRYAELNSTSEGTVLPKRILIYRDGVGDGDIKHVYEYELNDILNKINEFYRINMDNNQDMKLEFPKIGFIIVNKRTNARFMTVDSCDKYSNPKPGTVVSDVITMPERYDFYMVSQNVSESVTVCPTYYNVIKEDFYLSRPDIIHQITYKLCHSYFNWAGTTRIPSVVQYAKKLAFLVGQYVHDSPYMTMSKEKQLYFL